MVCLDDNDIANVTVDAFFEEADDRLAQKWAFENLPATKLIQVNSTETYVAYAEDLEVEQIGPREWKIKISYEIQFGGGSGGLSGPQPGQASDYCVLSFNLTSEKRIATTSIETYYSPSPKAPVKNTSDFPDIADPPNTGKMMGLTKDSLEGVEVRDRSFKFSITGFFNSSSVNDLTFLALLYSLVGNVNNATYLQFAAGELMIDSISGESTAKPGVQLTPITFNFEAKANFNNVADTGFTNLTCYGHDVVEYRLRKKNINGILVDIPAYRYIHRTFELVDMSQTGLNCS